MVTDHLLEHRREKLVFLQEFLKAGNICCFSVGSNRTELINTREKKRRNIFHRCLERTDGEDTKIKEWGTNRKCQEATECTSGSC